MGDFVYDESDEDDDQVVAAFTSAQPAAERARAGSAASPSPSSSSSSSSSVTSPKSARSSASWGEEDEGDDNGGDGGGGGGEEEEEEDEDEDEDEDDDDEDEEDEQPPKAVVPPWACRYCGIADPHCCARVLESGWWFCNSTGGTTASHLIHHLVRSRCKELCLHADSPLGETIIECFNCLSRNIFMMGFLPKGDGVVVLLCRNCLGIGALKEEWDSEQWTPLIKDRSLVPWLVKVPEPELEQRARHLTTAQIDRLEAMWKTNPAATLEDLERPGAEDELEPVLIRYEDGFHFQNVFGPLVQVEADYDRDMKEALREDNVSVRWHERTADDGRVDPGKWIAADVMFSAGASESMRLTIGDELLLRLSRRLLAPSRNNKTDWETKATVVHVGEPGEPTAVEVRASSRPPLDTTEGYSVSFVWKPITFDRMQFAMKLFAVTPSAVSTFLYHKILGHDVADAASAPPAATFKTAPGLPALNPSQQAAVQQVLPRQLALIQGPPGTGKTVTMATLVYNMVQAGKQKNAQLKGPVLVCAPSNVAVDHVAQKIGLTGVKVVRLSAKSREHIGSSIEHLTLHAMVQRIENGGGDAASNAAAAEPGGAKRKVRKRPGGGGGGGGGGDGGKRKRKLEKELLAAADVVCCTCSGAGDPRLQGMKFRRVLIDEATQATEPESLIPVVMGCEQFILVGDHCQLGPVVMSKRAANAGLNSSLFERLVTLGLRPVRLQVQYRMHPCLSEWPSNIFYEGSLQNGVTPGDRSSTGIAFPWIDPQRPMMFIVCQGTEEIAATGTSFLNRAEGTACEKIVTALLRCGVLPGEVGVITPYEGQRAFIVAHLQRIGPLTASQYAQVEVSSVDAFQGREKEFIIVSCVRSNEKQGIGFLNDPRRLNVALTRAKRGLIMLGNPRVLAKRPLWNDLITHFKDRGLLVEGGLSNLQASLMRFPSAKKYYRDPRQRRLEESMRPVFSGDVRNPYGDALAMAPPVGVGFGDFDYGGLTEAMAGMHVHTQFSQQSAVSSTPLALQSNLAAGPVTQQSQRSQQSQPL